MRSTPSAPHGTGLAPAAEAAGSVADSTTDLADLFVLLAAAFAPPPAALRGRDWCESLADDLSDLGAALEMDTAAAERALRESAVGPLAGERWLVEYSRLFLVPPVPVTLNTGIYLEGGLAGVSAQMMAQCYATAGFVQREAFRDLPDHVAIQLEFVGALLDRAVAGDGEAVAMAREFAEGFIVHWAEPLQRACAKAVERSSAVATYLTLAEVLEAAVDRLLK